MSTNLRRADDRCLTLKQSRKQEFSILGARFKGDKYNTLVAWLRTPFRGRLLRSCVRKIQSVDQEFFELLSVDVRPFLPSTLPRKLAAFFTFDPLVLPDLFFDKVGDPVERIGIKSARSSQRWEWISRTRLLRTDPKR
jgi:hypothetical protein